MRGFLMVLGRLFYHLGLARWIIQMRPGHVRGVLYHAIDCHDTAYNRGLRLSVSPETLDRQLAFFSQYYQLVGTADIEKPSHSASLAISFDDGFRSVYHSAWPILQKYNAPASIFLVTTAVQQQLLWFNALNWALHEQAEVARTLLAGYLPEPLPDSPRDCIIAMQEHSAPGTIEKLLRELHEALPFDHSHELYLTSSLVNEMRTGGIDFGFHTANHYNLINCSTEEIARQLDSSELRSLLSDCSFAYPYGYYDADVLAEIERRGLGPVMCVGIDNGLHYDRHFDRVEIYHVDAASIFAQLEVTEPLLALLRRWQRRPTGRRSS